MLYISSHDNVLRFEFTANYKAIVGLLGNDLVSYPIIFLESYLYKLPVQLSIRLWSVPDRI